jgi:uncharacterized protein
MKQSLLSWILLLALWVSLAVPLPGQTTLDHKAFLEKMKKSSTIVYEECLAQYDAYLKNHPHDVSVQVERCRFIQMALYDYDTRDNPNYDAYVQCVYALSLEYPDHPEVLLLRMDNAWGEELMLIFDMADISIARNPDLWSNESLKQFHLQKADHHYYESEYQEAYTSILAAIVLDDSVKGFLLTARILLELKGQKAALEMLKSYPSTTRDPEQLTLRADLFLQLGAFSEAFALYQLVDEIDPDYIENDQLARALEGMGEFEGAREYLLRDTSRNWYQEMALRDLHLHDLKYQNGELACESYNAFRDLGYRVDPLGLHRLKLLFTHPSQPWRARDLPGLFAMIGAILLLFIVPAIWILPIYFIGHHWKLIHRSKDYPPRWGLKWFWIVSYGMLLSVIPYFIFHPHEINYLFIDQYYDIDPVFQDQGRWLLFTTLTMGLFGIAALYKRSLRILLTEHWSVRKCLIRGITMAILLAIITTSFRNILFATPHLLLSSTMHCFDVTILSISAEIEMMLNRHGVVWVFLFLCLFVPLYEEIIFRGVILDACTRYLNFRSANIIQAVLFGMMHGEISLFPIYFLFGMITGILRKRSGGLLAGIVLHATNNLMFLLVLWLQ